MNMIIMSNHNRMITNSPEKGEFRHQIYKEAIERYNKAIKDEYYLEATTLMESLISDRLESRALFLGKKASFQTLGRLCDMLESDSVLSDIIPSVRIWAKSRNTALHTLAKIEDGNYQTFKEKYLETKTTAMEGIRLFRKIDKTLAQSRDQNGSHIK